MQYKSICDCQLFNQHANVKYVSLLFRWNLSSVDGQEKTCDKVFNPSIGDDERNAKFAKWNKAVVRSLDWETSDN